MKRFKKMMAIAIACAMIIGTMSFGTLGAFAADPEPASTAQSIKLTGLEKGDQVTFYKVLSWAETTQAATENGAVNGWYWVAPFNTAFDKNGDKGQAKLKAAVNDKNELMLTDTLAGEIARVINNGTPKPTPVNSTPLTVGENSDSVICEFAALGQSDPATKNDGLYIAIITPADTEYVYNPVFVHLDSSTTKDSFNVPKSSSYYNNGAAKKSQIPLDKDSKNASDYNGDQGDTAKPGDVLDFTVTTAIPGYGETFQHPRFIVTDQMNHLKLLYPNDDDTDFPDDNLKKITVKVGGEEVAEGVNTYTLTKDATGYTITFAEAYLKNLHVATALKIEYKAKVLEGANTNVIKEKNTVTLDFSHNPSTENDSTPGGEHKYKKDITNHYTFSLDADNLVGPYRDRIGESGSEIIKIDVDKDGNPIKSETKTYSKVTTNNYQASPLAGAEFELLDKDKHSFNPPKTATSDANGRINFKGLDAGVYWLKETKAPAGYVKKSDPVKITINATLKPRTITEYYDQAGNWYATGGTGRTAYTYKVDELESYSVTYGEGTNAIASSYTFGHIHESNNGEIKWSIATSSEVPQSFVNTKGVELPSTGGMGTTLFYIIGAILIIGAGVLLVTRRRTESAE